MLDIRRGSAALGDHESAARWRLPNDGLKISWSVLNLGLKKAQTQRVEVLPVVAVIEIVKAADAATGQPRSLNVLVETALRLGVNQLDAWAVDFRDRDGRFALLNLGCQELVKRFERSGRKVQRLGQRNIVKLFEIIAQHGIDFGVRRERLEGIGIADAFFLHELNWQENQRRIKTLRRLLLQVRPAQKAQHQPQLAKAIFCSLSRCGTFTANPIEHAGQIDRFLESKIAIQGKRFAGDYAAMKLVVPGKDLLRPDRIHIER